MVACANLDDASWSRLAIAALYADVIGGVTTFFTMAYIVVVNPASCRRPGPGMPFSGALTATVLIASSMTLLMGLYARLPFAVAPGMGLNAFFAFTIVLQSKVPWQTALGMVFWAGVLFLLVSATPLREQIALAIPAPLRSAAAAGIGLLLTFIGLRNAGLIVGDPATLVRMGTLDHRAAFLLLGILVAAALMRRNNPLAFLAAIFSVTALAWTLGLREAAGHAGQRAGLFVGVPGARHPRRAQAGAAAGDRRDPLHRSVRLAVDVHRRRQRGRPHRSGRPADQPAPRPDRRRAGDARRRVWPGTSPGTAYVESIAGHPHGRPHRAARRW